jgi:5-dehydro-4-deoxyglucarate dehydratase
MSQNFARLAELMKRYVNPFYALRERMKGYEVAAVKEGMELLGLTAGPVRPPLVACRPKDREDLRAIMKVYEEML